MDEESRPNLPLKSTRRRRVFALLIASALLSAASAQNAKDAVKPAVKGAWLDKNLLPTSGPNLVIQQE